MNIWLDPNRVVPRGWTHARNLKDIEEIFLHGPVLYMSMCYDLKLTVSGRDFTGLDVAKWMKKNNMWPKRWLNVHEEITFETDPQKVTLARELFQYLKKYSPIKPSNFQGDTAFHMADEGIPVKDRVMWILRTFSITEPITIHHDMLTFRWDATDRFINPKNSVLFKGNDGCRFRCAGVSADASHLLVSRYHQDDPNLYGVGFEELYQAVTGMSIIRLALPNSNFTLDRRVKSVEDMLSSINNWTWFTDPMPTENVITELRSLARKHLERMTCFRKEGHVDIRVQNGIGVTSGRKDYLDALLLEMQIAIVDRETFKQEDGDRWAIAANAFYRIFHLVSTTGYSFYETGNNLTIWNPVPRIDHIARIFAAHAAHLITFGNLEESPWEPLIDIWAMGYYPDKIDSTTGKYTIFNISEVS